MNFRPNLGPHFHQSPGRGTGLKFSFPHEMAPYLGGRKRSDPLTKTSERDFEASNAGLGPSNSHAPPPRQQQQAWDRP